jgi:hypothetical protein
MLRDERVALAFAINFLGTSLLQEHTIIQSTAVDTLEKATKYD